MKLIIPNISAYSNDDLINALVDLRSYSCPEKESEMREYYNACRRGKLEEQFNFYHRIVYSAIAEDAKFEFFANLTKQKLAGTKISKLYQYEN